jgi:seryl-tRNA synthetase
LTSSLRRLLLSTAATAPSTIGGSGWGIRARPDYSGLIANEEAKAVNAERRAHPGGAGAVRRAAAAARELRDLESQIQGLRAARNKGSADYDKALLKAKEVELRHAEALARSLVLSLPNDAHPESPVGDEGASQVVRLSGEKQVFPFPAADHASLNERLGLFDAASGSRVAGPRFVFLKGQGAMLELALVQWAMKRLVSLGHEPVLPPDIVRAEAVAGAGFQPRGQHSQVYSLEDPEEEEDGRGMCLAGTSELSLASMHAGSVLAQTSLPLKYAGFSHCFRREAGAGGRDTRGIYRLHQFSKVEMFGVCDAQSSEALLGSFLETQCALHQDLGLHFQVRDMATQDLGAPANRKFDLEAWMPGRGAYGELCSASSCTDYQARRLDIRIAKPGGGTELAHTVNATALAVPRVIIALVEQGQQQDGSVLLPKVLWDLFGSDRLKPLPASKAK